MNPIFDKCGQQDVTPFFLVTSLLTDRVYLPNVLSFCEYLCISWFLIMVGLPILRALITNAPLIKKKVYNIRILEMLFSLQTQIIKVFFSCTTKEQTRSPLRLHPKPSPPPPPKKMVYKIQLAQSKPFSSATRTRKNVLGFVCVATCPSRPGPHFVSISSPPPLRRKQFIKSSQHRASISPPLQELGKTCQVLYVQPHVI